MQRFLYKKGTFLTLGGGMAAGWVGRENAWVNWLTLVSTAVGGAVALLGSVLAHWLRSRDERSRSVRADRRHGYVEYLIALDAAHARLRQIADPDDSPEDIAMRARRSFGETGVYEAREKLLLSANPAVVVPAEDALRKLAVLRSAVRDGAKLHTVPYHDAYHPYAEALWRLRSNIRVDLGSAALTASDLDKPSWDEQANCDFCQQHRIPAQATA
jgi:hypothetical protein